MRHRLCAFVPAQNLPRIRSGAERAFILGPSHLEPGLLRVDERKFHWRAREVSLRSAGLLESIPQPLPRCGPVAARGALVDAVHGGDFPHIEPHEIT